MGSCKAFSSTFHAIEQQGSAQLEQEGYPDAPSREVKLAEEVDVDPPLP